MAEPIDFGSAGRPSAANCRGFNDNDRGSSHYSHHDHTESSSLAEEEKVSPGRPSAVSRHSTGRGLSHRHSRASSVSSTSTNPLEPLELALSSQIPPDALWHVRSTATAATGTSAWSRPPEYEVTFDSPTDPKDPRQWPFWYRMWTIFCVSYSTWAVVLYSTSYTAAIPGLQEEFGEDSSTVVTLGVTTFLLGLAAGSLVVAPMSELFGRRPVYLICLTLSALLIIPCALATSLAEIIAVRFLGALFGAAMISNGAGTIADISTEDDRALYMSLWSIAPLNGPVTGPLIGGFVFQYLGWRWENWVSFILTCVAALLMATVRETYTPKVLQQKAAQRRKEEDDERYWCLYDDSKRSTLELMRTNLSRPIVLSATEPILWFFNLWISVIYGILYLCFVAYPIVFEQERGWGPGETGLSFIGIGIGTMIAIGMEPVWRKIINSHAKDPETGRAPPEASASIMSIGAVLTPIGQLVFSWTCLPTSIHYAIPIAFGIPFGLGNTLCFIYGTNYLAGSYGYYAASALAGNAVTRSIFGATLPLAGPSMYAKLTPQWAGTLLGLMEVVLIPIPFAFYKFGDRIRARSPVIRAMREEQARNDRKRARLAAKTERQRGIAAGGVVVDDEAGRGAANAASGNGDESSGHEIQHAAANDSNVNNNADKIGSVKAAVEEKDVEKGA